jgi:preprotein translocase subunit SecE
MSSEESHENESDVTEADAEASVDGAELASDGSDALAQDEEGAGKKTLGTERWVQLAFITTALLLMWLFDNAITGFWYLFADPTETLVSLAAVVLGIVGSIGLYRTPAVYGLVHDVAEEMARVSWPTRKETSQSTIVVVVTSIVAAIMLFLFDSVWSAVTDLVYKV